MPKRSPKAATEIAQYDREARALDMRAQGHNFQSIADALNYADASGASKAYHRALARKPAQNVDQIRAQEAERLEYCWRKASEVIENPPLVHSAIGKTVPDPRPGREGLFLTDERAKISAITEYRHLSESYRKMCGVDLPAKAPEVDQSQEIGEFLSYIDSLADGNQRLRAEVAALKSRLAAYEADDGSLILPAQLVF